MLQEKVNKKKILYAFLICAILFIAFIGARQLGNFGNNLSSGNITFFDDENLTIYLNISRYSNVSYAYLNFSGYPLGEGNYTGEHWDTGDSGTPVDITTDGTYFWIVDVTEDEVYKYDMSGNYISSWDTSAQSETPWGITTNGANIWVVDWGDREVYKYQMDGTYVDSWDTAGSGNSYPRGMTNNGNYIWIGDPTADKIFKYNMSGSYISSWNTNALNGDGYGLTTDGNYIWVHDIEDDEVYKYDMSGSYISKWSPDALNGEPYALTTYGNYFWVTDTVDNEVYKYLLAEDYPTESYLEVGTPDVITEGTYVSNYWDTTEENGHPEGITQNGTYFWIADYWDSKVYKYQMDGTYTGESWTAPNPSSITTNNSYIWVIDITNDKIYKYDMDGIYVSQWSLTTPHVDPEGIATNNSYIWITDSTNDKIYIYDMVGNYVSNWTTTDSNALNADPDSIMYYGTNLWISDWFDDKVYKYDMDGSYTGESWDTETYGAGLTTDGTNIWNSYHTTGQSGVYEYYMNGNPINHWEPVGIVGLLRGITQNNTFIWTIDSTTDDKIYKYDMIGTYVSNWSLNVLNANPYGITTNNTYFWITDTTNAEVYKYQMDGTYVDSWDTAGSGNGGLRGITTNNTFIWITDYNDNEVYKYDMDGNYVSNWSLNVLNGYANGITQDGTYFWIGDAVDDKVYKYDMDGSYTGYYWDVAGAQEITQNGTYFWTSDFDTQEVYKYYAKTLNTEWYYEGKFNSIISEGTYMESWVVNAKNEYPHGVTTNNTFIWVVENINDAVYKYDMEGNYIANWSTQTTNPRGITQNGTYFWVTDYNTDEIYKHYMNGTYISNWSTHANNDYAIGITTNNTFIWVSDYYKHVFKYDMEGNYLSNWSTNLSNTPRGITTDGNYFWIADSTIEEVFKYQMDGTYISSWDIGITGNNVARGITTDGTYFWIADSTSDKVYKYYMEYYLLNKTSNISASINSALNNGACDCTGCSLDGDNCSIPFLFHSETIGKLEYLSINISYMVGLTRNTKSSIGANATVDRTLSSGRDASDSLQVTTFIERVRIVVRSIFSFFQMLFSLFTKGTFLPFNWITSTETTTQGQAIEGIRVPWEINDTWLVDATAPQNFTNSSRTYSLPADCGNVYIEIDGVNMSGSMYVNNTGCTYSVYNNRTLQPTNTSFVNVSYTTGKTTSSEGSWLAFNKRINNQTRWRNTLTMSNPTIHDYVDISVNITSDKLAIPASVKVINSTNDVLTHAFENTLGNVDWNLTELDSGDTEVATIDYNTTIITLAHTLHDETVLGKVYDIHNITLTANSTRSILTVYSSFNFTDTDIISNKLYKCSGELTGCNEDISNRIDVAWSDEDGDGDYDFVEWYVTNLTQNQSYQLRNDQGYPIQITESTTILNPPIKPFDTISWQTTISMYNPNAFSTEKVYKYQFPLGSRDVELDNIGKNLQYDPYGTLAPYITIVDKADTSHLSSVYLSPGETKTFAVTYRTDSVTVYSSTYFPTYFEVEEDALIVQTLRVKNQAENNVTDVEYRIPINYAEKLTVCDGEYKSGCPDKDDSQYNNVTLDTKDILKGDYKLEVEDVEAGESKMITLSYYVPTAIVEKVEKGRRSVQGVLADFKKVTILSTSPYTMDDLRYKELEVATANVIDVFECQATGICDIPLVYTNMEVKLGAVAVGERIQFYIWSISEGEVEEYESWIGDAWNWFLENVWNGGKKIQIEGFWKYIIGWLSNEDPTTGKLYIPLGRLIFIGSIIGLITSFIIWIGLRKRRKN